MNYAICNETFEGWEHARICSRIAVLGYRGLEIAPFTLAKDIREVSASQRKQLKDEATKEGVTILGLHWLLKNTEGFYLTSPDVAIQKRTGDYFAALAEACAELGGDILVLGSPLQRNKLPGVSTAMANDCAAATIGHCLKTLEKTGVKLCLEPLGKAETDFMNTAAEGISLIEKITHPNLKLHLDVKAMSDESTPIPAIIKNSVKHFEHFHANDVNRRGPGFGDVDFKPIMQALSEVDYRGWVSVEVFDYSPDPDTIARESIADLKRSEPLHG